VVTELTVAPERGIVVPITPTLRYDVVRKMAGAISSTCCDSTRR
jgi:hypothetical protein